MAGILKGLGIRRNNCFVSFLVVGQRDLCQNISENLHKVAKTRKWSIVVHQCESISQLLKRQPNLYVDFVILIFDLSLTHSLSEVEFNLSLLDNRFIIRDCICLINSSRTTLSNTSLAFYKWKNLQSKYKIRFLAADAYKSESFLCLGQRILNIIEATFGINTGIPVICQ